MSADSQNFYQKKNLTKNICSQCALLQRENEKFNSHIQQLKRIEVQLNNQVKDLKQECQDLKSYLEESNIELNIYQEKWLKSGQQQKTNIELRRTILQLEEDNLIITKKLKESYEELEFLKSEFNQEHKFIDSLIQMVMSCQPEWKQPPPLKVIWKWLKMVLSEFIMRNM